MKFRTSYIRLVLVMGAIATCIADEPQVMTNFGLVRGTWMKTYRGANIEAYLGLPYAKPPVGDLRLQNPVPWTEKWDDVRNATEHGNKCPQPQDDTVGGDEDCLHVNVYTPDMHRELNETREKKLSVIVLIHGTSCYTKRISDGTQFRPTYLLDYDVILVTIDYRIGVLGFFSTGNEVAPGNYGLKDIALSLSWVRDNIASFGGDPNSVTLFGSSSAAGAVHLLASSDATEGLFQKLITMSGTATGYWNFHSRENSRNSSMRLANLLGCDDVSEDPSSRDSEIKETTEFDDTESDMKILECIRKANLTDIVQKGRFPSWRGNPTCVFGPTLEAEAEGAVLTVHPIQSLHEGLFRDIPWITGVVSDEGLIKPIVSDLLLDKKTKDEFLKYYDTRFIPDVLEMPETFNNNTEVNEAFQNYYFDGDIKTYIERNLTELVGDGFIYWPMYSFLEEQITKQKSNVYLYMSAYQGTFSFTVRSGIPYRLGVAHSSDLNFLTPYLNVRYEDLHFSNTMSDITMVNIMCEMWTNFMKTGVPSARLTADWEPYQKHRRFMRFGKGSSTETSMQANFLPERMAFWAELMSNFSAPIKETRVDDNDDEVSESAASLTVNCMLYLGAIIFCSWWSLVE